MNDHSDEDFISKSEIKREMHRYQELGETLAKLAPAAWQAMPISERLMDALLESRRITQNEARRRHVQYLGKLMRDENIEAIQEAMDLLDPSSEAYGRKIRQLELWRQKLIDDNNSLNAYIERHPAVDRQQLRNLVRNARKEVAPADAKPGNHYKKLFQFLRQQDQESRNSD